MVLLLLGGCSSCSRQRILFFFQIGEWLGVDTRLGMSLMF